MGKFMDQLDAKMDSLAIDDPEYIRLDEMLNNWGKQIPVNIETNFTDIMGLLAMLEVVLDRGVVGTTPAYLEAVKEWHDRLDAITDEMEEANDESLENFLSTQDL